MTRLAKILVVDDHPMNVKLLEDLLIAKNHVVSTAASGAEALEKIEKESPDLVLLDVVMPEMSGYEVCRKIREKEGTRLLPVVMVTALDPSEERVKGIEAGADDFLEKPIKSQELLARVRSLLRIKELHDTVEQQKKELADWNLSLEERVNEQLAELDRLARLKRFFSPQLAELIVTGGAEGLLRSHRRNITVVFVDLRGFTAFSEVEEPEEVMGMLGEFHAEMGRLIVAYEGTLERFTGDGMMVFFNDPVELSAPEERGMRMAVAMRDAFSMLRDQWLKRGYDLALGIGVTSGYATLGAIGFEGRFDYAAVGSVVNLAARLCDESPGGHILISQRILGAIEGIVETEPYGELSLKGFPRAVTAHNVIRLRDESSKEG